MTQHYGILGKQAFTNKKKLFTDNLSIELKKIRVKSVLWSVVLYMHQKHGNDSSRQKEIRSHGNVDLKKGHRVMARISWVDKISNEEVPQRVNETKSIYRQ